MRSLRFCCRRTCPCVLLMRMHYRNEFRIWSRAASCAWGHPEFVKGRGHAAILAASQPSALRLCRPVPSQIAALDELSPHSGLFVRSGQKHELSALRPFQMAPDTARRSFLRTRIFKHRPYPLLSRLSLGASNPATHGRFKTSIGVNVQ